MISEFVWEFVETALEAFAIVAIGGVFIWVGLQMVGLL